MTGAANQWTGFYKITTPVMKGLMPLLESEVFITKDFMKLMISL